MKAYVQMLAILLCSCFVQDAFAETMDSAEEALKYPNLLKVNDMFWDTLKDMNNENLYGALTIRAARNAISDVLASKQFWLMLESGVARRVKLTTEPDRAAQKVRTCDKLTALLTNRRLADRLPGLVDFGYEYVVGMDLTLVKQALTLANEIIDGGRVPKVLVMMRSVVQSPRRLQLMCTLGLNGLKYLS